MSGQLMSRTQSRRDALWTLAPGEALRLTVGPGPRQLRVVEARAAGRFQLLVPPQPRPWRAWQARVTWWLRGFRPAPPRGLRA